MPEAEVLMAFCGQPIWPCHAGLSLSSECYVKNESIEYLLAVVQFFVWTGGCRPMGRELVSVQPGRGTVEEGIME